MGLPKCYGPNKSCGHVLQVYLQHVATNTLHLTTFDNLYDDNGEHSSINIAAMFIQTVIFKNPLWDLGLQHQVVQTNDHKLYKKNKSTEQYTSKCICPCSVLFSNWHKKTFVDMLPKFKSCSSDIFEDHNSFVKHLYSQHDEYYRQIVLRIVQSSYSALISKIRITPRSNENQETANTLMKLPSI